MEAARAEGIDEILTQYDVTDTTLASGEKDALDRNGYIVLPNVMDSAWLDRLRSAFENAAVTGRPGTRESGTRHLNDLVNGDSAFEAIYSHPRLLAAVYHVLRCPFRLGQMNGREPMPGFGEQGLHADWIERARGEPFRIVTAVWLLDDFTPDNGATRLVPGTHFLLTQPPKSLAAPASRHPEQKIVVAKAGSVLVFNGHLWHSGTRNESQLRRRVVQCSFVGRDEVRFGRIKVDAPERKSPSDRYLLGDWGQA
jgi:ectoine hydroxylase-related dioxygenase (phytanoyl-CoA dioxygenase family)